ncbi:MAG: glycosyltransferase [Anaerolineae bacterium]
MILFALWDRVDNLALGGVKYAFEIERRLSSVQPLSIVTQRIGLKGEVPGSSLNRFAGSGARRIFYYLMLLAVTKAAIANIRRNGASAVASFGVGWVNDVAAWLASSLTGRKLIMIFYHWPYEGYSAGQVMRAMRAEGRGILAAALATIDRMLALRALRSASLVVTLSEDARRNLSEMAPAVNAVVVHPGVDDAFFSGQPERPQSDYHGIAVNRIAPEKGVYDLVDIWSTVVRRRPGARLAVVGHSTGMLDQWIAEIRSRGLERNVVYLGTMNSSGVAAMHRRSKIFLFPSHREGFGIAVAEAMASGLPVVCYDIPPMNEVFRSPGVFFVREGDRAAFADVVLRLLDDPTLLEEAGRANAQFAKAFNWDEAARRFELAVLGEIASK